MSSVAWWKSRELYGELEVVLGLISEARSHGSMDEERATRKLFDGLNRAWNAFRQLATSRPESDWQALKALFSEGLSDDQAVEFVASDELSTLAAIEPPILDHSVLLGHGILGSMQQIPAGIQSQAGQKHLRFRRRLERLQPATTHGEVRRCLVQLADLLYVIRSNLMHGEKFGPDPQRRSRDRVIAAASTRVLELFFDVLFDHPSCRLAVYGSLRPGGPNAHALNGIEGSWDAGVIYGTLEQEVGFSALRWGFGADEIDVLILTSQELPNHFELLDEFEGSRYKRVLAPVMGPEGEILVANLYGSSASSF